MDETSMYLKSIIARGKRKKIQNASGVYVYGTEKVQPTQTVIWQWVDLSILSYILRNSKKGLFVWDSASTHGAKQMNFQRSTEYIK